MDFNKKVVVIGNFDGCHLGHRKLVAKANEMALEMGLPSMALTFDPNPKVFLGALGPQELIFTLEQKVRALRELGLDGVCVKTFDQEFMHMPAPLFFQQILKQECQAAAIIVGDDFHFGYQQGGDVQVLKSFCDPEGIALYPVSLLCSDGNPVKSSVVREDVMISGDVAGAEKLLGHYFSLEGTIHRGRQLGRTIGVPTANLGDVRQLIPKVGVYAGYAAFQPEKGDGFLLTMLPHGAIPAVINVGKRPTVSANEAVTIEAHLLVDGIGPDALYGLSAIFYFAHRLRDEVKFADLGMLKLQINRDIHDAEQLLKPLW